jgi:hypothetical protein
LTNLAERQKELEWEIFNLNRHAFAGRQNKGALRQERKLREELNKIKGILYPRKKRYGS